MLAARFESGQDFSTSDMSSARSTLQDVYSPLELRTFEANDPRETSEIVFRGTRVGESTVSYLGFSHGAQVTCSVDYYHVDVVVQGERYVDIAGKCAIRTRPGQAIVWTPRQSAKLRWTRGCAHLAMTVPEHRMREELETMLCQPAGAPVEFHPHMDVTTEHTRSWTETFRLVQHQLERNVALQHRVSAGTLERLLIQGLLLTQPHNYSAQLRSPETPAPPPIVRDAMDLIKAHPEHPWTVTELAQQVAASVRSLQYGFRQSVGLSPSRYLREVRLDRVRTDLRAADPTETTVTQLATRWGFHDCGHFAAIYRRKFGEMPSVTLRK